MSIPSSITPLFSTGAGGAAGYQIERSLRFNSNDSAFCSRTPAVAGNRKTWTVSCWIKRAALGSTQYIFEGGSPDGSTTRFALRFNSTDTINILNNGTLRTTTQVFRDVSAWYHILLAVDTTQSTASNRIRFYVNGSEITTFSSSSDPSPNADTGWNMSAVHSIGTTHIDGGNYLNAYLADFYSIDGQALTPAAFTEVSATTGQLIPKAYAGTYTGNSFWLKFNDNSAATATTLGKDSFLLGNNWTPNNLSVTAGAGNDSLVDTPTSYGTPDTGVGGEVRGNYATWNPLNTKGTLTNGNLDGATTTTDPRSLVTTLAVSSGKWYTELTCSSTSANCSLGVSLATFPVSSSSRNYSFGDGVAYYADGTKYVNGTNSSYGASYATNDVIGVAIDFDNNQITFYKNGSSQGAISKTLLGSYVISVTGGNSAVSETVILNAGQRAFAYQTPGTNRPAATFLALVDTNLGAPVVAKPNTVMDVALYTGNGGTQSITGLAFSPDLVWIKCRTASVYHALFDVVRGVNKRLGSNETSAEQDQAPSGLSAFDSSGFTVVDGATGGNGVNGSPGGLYAGSAAQYVGWAWDAGTSTVSNTAGSITGGAQVRANPSAGFSIITFTMGSGSYTVGHGLNTAPSLLITKARSNTSSWWTYHASLGTGSYLALNSTAAAASDYSWGSAPTSTVFTANNNFFTNGYTYVVYAFSPVAGYSSAFSFTGNGSSDGPMVWLGFKPRFLFIKRTDSASHWPLYDTARNPYNVTNSNVWASTSDGEITDAAYSIDILSNGFKLRTSDAARNASGGTYIGFAWAENPFQYARAR